MLIALLKGVKDSLCPCCKDTGILSLVRGRSSIIQLESTKSVCQGPAPVPASDRCAFILGCVQSEQCEPGGLGYPNPRLAEHQTHRSGISAILQLSYNRWAPFTAREEHQSCLSSCPSTGCAAGPAPSLLASLPPVRISVCA